MWVKGWCERVNEEWGISTTDNFEKNKKFLERSRKG